MEPQDRRDIETLFAHLEQLIRDIGTRTPQEWSPEFLTLVRQVAAALAQQKTVDIEEENTRLKAALDRVTAMCDEWIASCCGDKVDTRFCEQYGCGNISELRALAQPDPLA